MTDLTVLNATITPTGMSRLFGHDQGPAQIAAAVLETTGGHRIAVPFTPDTAAATIGRTTLVVGAPNGGCQVEAIGLLAEDGAAIMWARERGGPFNLAGGDTLTLQITSW